MPSFADHACSSPANPLIAKLERGCELHVDDRDRLKEICSKSRTVLAREDVIRDGEAPADVHLIMRGFAYRYKLVSSGRRSIMAIFVPGDFCDLDVALLKTMDHTIGTFTDCTVVEIPRATVKELTENHPNIANALRWATLVDEATLREWLVNMGQRLAENQLAHFLCELRLRLAVVGMADEHSMYLPLTQQDMADTLGLSTVHVNRVLQHLREQGLPQTHGRNITIPDLSRLEKFADFNPDYLHLKLAGTTPVSGKSPG